MFILVNKLFELVRAPGGDGYRELLRLTGAIIAEVEVAVVDADFPLERLVSPDRDHISKVFPDLGLYWTLWAPLELNAKQEPLVGDAIDDLLSILEDLADGLVLGDAGATLANWKFSFSVHWGRHAVGLQYALGASLIGTRSTTSTKS